MTSSVWYLAISKAVVWKYERWQQRKRFQASSQVARSAIVCFASLRVCLRLVIGCNSGGVFMGRSSFLNSTYSPLRISRRSFEGTGGAHETDDAEAASDQ